MTTFEVTLMKKGTFNGKRVLVQAWDKEHAFKRALGLQPNAGTWMPMTAVVEASRMETKFKHKGVRYTV